MSLKSPLISKTTKTNKADVRNVVNSTVVVIQVNSEDIGDSPNSLTLDHPTLRNLKQLAPFQFDSEAIKGEYHDQVNYARDLINDKKPQSALDFLLDFEKNKWSRLDDNLKFRVKANIGASYLGLGNYDASATAFIEAKQYNPNDTKALLNYALGNLFFGNYSEVVDTARSILEKDPNNEQAYGLLVQGLAESETFEDIISKVPEKLRNSNEVSSALGFVALKKGAFEDAILWNEKALVLDPDSIEIKTSLANSLLNSVANDKPLTDLELISSEEKDIVRKSIELYSQVWEQVKDTQLDSYKIQCLVNRSMAYRILGDYDLSLKDQELALSLEPKNPRNVLLKASLLFEKKDYEKAESLLRGIIDDASEPSSPLLLADILRIQGKVEEAISIVSSKITPELQQPLDREYRRYLISLFLYSNKIKEAEEVAQELDNNHSVNIATKASILREKGQQKESQKLLDDAKKKLNKGSTKIDILALAYEFYSIKDFNSASGLLEKVIDSTEDNELTRKLLNCYHHLGNDQAILEICSNLRTKYEVVRDLTELESSVLEEVGDLELAEEVCKRHLALYPDDTGIKVRLSLILYRLQKLSELETLLLTDFSIEKLTLDARIQLAQMYQLTGASLKAIDLMYEARREYFGESIAHSKYIAIFFSREKSLDLDNSRVVANTAVCIEESSGKKYWYVIEDRENPDLAKNELNLDSSLAKRLLGKKKGDEVLLNEGNLQKKLGHVCEIKNKYVYALHQSGEVFNTLFPEDDSFLSLDLKIDEKENKVPQVFLNMLDAQEERHRQVIDIYKDGKATLGVIGRLLGRSLIDTWGYAINRDEVGLRSSLGTPQETRQAFNLLSENKNPLTLDLISLLTIHGINLADEFVKCFGKPYIARSTLDEILEVVTNRRTFSSEGYLATGKENGNYVKEEVSKEKIEENTKYLEGIFKWAEENCVVVPVRENLGITAQKKSELVEMLGRSSFDSIAIAKQKVSILVSDDFWLRSLAKNEYGVQGVWSQDLLRKLVEVGSITKEAYEKAIVRLVCSNYSYTAIDSDTLLEAARQSHWQPSFIFNTVVKLLGKEDSDFKSSMFVVEDFIVKLYMNSIYLPTTEALVLASLDNAVPSQLAEKTVETLIIRLKRRLYFAPDRVKELENLLRKWLATRLV